MAVEILLMPSAFAKALKDWNVQPVKPPKKIQKSIWLGDNYMEMCYLHFAA